jgi:hypothetical protein
MYWYSTPSLFKEWSKRLDDVLDKTFLNYKPIRQALAARREKMKRSPRACVTN